MAESAADAEKPSTSEVLTTHSPELDQGGEILTETEEEDIDQTRQMKHDAEDVDYLTTTHESGSQEDEEEKEENPGEDDEPDAEEAVYDKCDPEDDDVIRNKKGDDSSLQDGEAVYDTCGSDKGSKIGAGDDEVIYEAMEDNNGGGGADRVEDLTEDDEDMILYDTVGQPEEALGLAFLSGSRSLSGMRRRKHVPRWQLTVHVVVPNVFILLGSLTIITTTILQQLNQKSFQEMSTHVASLRELNRELIPIQEQLATEIAPFMGLIPEVESIRNYTDYGIDDCKDWPCVNGATCVDGINSFLCLCLQGYTGATCEADIDDCVDTPCANNATCEDGMNSFSCLCRPGYTGVTCQVDIDDCVDNPCANNATCVDGINSFSCLCPRGYTGLACETDIDECASNPCQSGQTCVDGIANYTCAHQED